LASLTPILTSINTTLLHKFLPGPRIRPRLFCISQVSWRQFAAALPLPTAPVLMRPIPALYRCRTSHRWRECQGS